MTSGSSARLVAGEFIVVAISDSEVQIGNDAPIDLNPKDAILELFHRQVTLRSGAVALVSVTYLPAGAQECNARV